jgi:hypothetical protein
MSEIVIIAPKRQHPNLWRDLWRYRELFYVLAWRDLAVRVEANSDRRGLGGDPAISDNGGLYSDFRADR